MINFCPSCGVKLDPNSSSKFCPNCGLDVSSFIEKAKADKYEIIICENCGEENDPGNIICSNCGARLNQHSKKFPAEKIISSSKKESGKPLNKSRQASAKKILPQDKETSRTLSKPQIITIIVVAFGFILILLIASGVFDSSPEGTTVTNSQQQDQSSGVNLNALKEINQLEEKIKANPGDTESLLHLAHLKNDSGLFEQAIQTYRQYLETNPEDADARVDMGVCYYNLKDYQTAIAEMKKAIEYKPKHQIAHLNLGIVNLTAGNLNDSKEWFRKAVQIDPNSEVGKRAKELLESH